MPPQVIRARLIYAIEARGRLNSRASATPTWASGAAHAAQPFDANLHPILRRQLFAFLGADFR
jgi:hypothetical protein